MYTHHMWGGDRLPSWGSELRVLVDQDTALCLSVDTSQMEW